MDLIITSFPYLFVFCLTCGLAMFSEIKRGIFQGSLVFGFLVFAAGAFSLVVPNLVLSFFVYFCTIAFFYNLLKVEFGTHDWFFWSRIILFRMLCLIGAFVITLVPDLSPAMSLVRTVLLIMSLPISNFELLPRSPWMSQGVAMIMAGTILQTMIGLDLVLELGGVPHVLLPAVFILFLLSAVRVFAASPGLTGLLSIQTFLTVAPLLVSCLVPSDLISFNILRLLAAIAPLIWILLLGVRDPRGFWFLLLMFVPFVNGSLAACIQKIDGSPLLFTYVAILGVSLIAVFKTALNKSRDESQFLFSFNGNWVGAALSTVLFLMFQFWGYLIEGRA